MAKVRINTGVGEVEFEPTAINDNEGGEPLPPADSENAILPTRTPRITETSSPLSTEDTETPPLTLPFVDTFDDWIRPEWTVIEGMPVVVNGRLCNAHVPLILELRYRLPDSYTISFDYFLEVNVFNDASVWLRIGDLVEVSMDDASFRFYLYDAKEQEWFQVGTAGLPSNRSNINIMMSSQKIIATYKDSPLTTLSYPFNKLWPLRLTIVEHDIEQRYCIDNFTIQNGR